MDPEPPINTDKLFTPRFFRLWVLSLVTFLSAFQLLPVVPKRILELGGSTAMAGAFLAAYTWASAFSAPFTGAIADHFGHRRTLIVAASAFAVFSLLYAVIPFVPLLLVVAVVHGCLWSGMLTSSGALMTSLIPETRRAEGIAYWGLASVVAVAFAPSIGFAIGSFGWWVLCVEMAVLSVAMLGIALTLPAGAVRSGSKENRPLLDLRLTITALSLACASFGYGGLTSYAALMAEARGITPRSLFFNAFAGSVFILRIGTAHMWNRFEPRRLLMFSLALIPPSLVLMAIAHDALGVAAASCLFGFGMGGAYPAFITWVMKDSVESRRAAMFGSVLWAFDTGIGAGSVVTGYLIQRFDYMRAFLFAAIIASAAIPVFLATSRWVMRPGPGPVVEETPGLDR